MAHGRGTLTARQQKGIDALLSAASVSAAAAQSGIGRRTLYRWIRECPEFVAALRDAEGLAVDQAARMLAGAGGQAVHRLVALADGAEREAVQLRAADAILARLLQLRELVALEARLAALEAWQNTTIGGSNDETDYSDETP
jgi:transposase-like protein